MNRRYDAAKYLAQVELARRYMPELVITTDIIVGFPNETKEDFERTLKLVEAVRFDAMFTFIYSKRVGTPAAQMEDSFSREEKQVNFDRLLETQNRISEEKHRAYIGTRHRVLLDGKDREDGALTGRTIGGRLVRVQANADRIGEFAQVRITDCNTWALKGEIVD
jgi:tRNA-2-methylthio-N6-dimethylallyladenosine synthase